MPPARSADRHRRLFTNFVNAKLSERDDVPPITDIFEDLRDGRLLYALLEELSGQSLASLGRPTQKGKHGKPLTRIDHVANLSISFRYIKQTTKIVGIGPGDVADGNEVLILGLLWSIIVFFAAKDLGGVENVSSLKKKILKWCQKRTEKNDDVEIRNLKDSFKDGRAFLAILHDVDPDFEYEPSPVATTQNFNRAFEEAKQRYGVPKLLDGDDAECWRDDQSMVTYLSELMKRLPESAKDMAGAALKYVDDHQKAMLKDLSRLCACPTIPGTEHAGASLIADLMKNDGLDVDIEDTNGGVVVGSWPKKDPSLPTVLFVADYGVDDPGDLWKAGDTEPFTPEEDGRGRLRAAGSVGKAGALAPIKAISALIRAASDETLAFNVDVLCFCGSYDDLEANGTLEKVVADRYGGESGDNKKPYAVVVDTYNCASGVADNKFAVAFGCRGECEVKVVCKIGDPALAEKDNYAVEYGPLIDVNQFLSHCLISFRDPENGFLVDVPGLVGLPADTPYKKVVENVEDMDTSNFTSILALPPGVTIAEHLMFHPGVSITDMYGDEKDLKGEATVFASLPPTFSPEAAIAGLKERFEGAAVWGSEVTVTASPQRCQGFLSSVESPFLAKLTEAAKKRISHRQIAVASSPVYLPLAAAVARALPTVATYACGFSDADAHAGDKDEAVAIDDVTATIKTIIHLLLSLKTLKPTTTHDGQAHDLFPQTTLPPAPPAAAQQHNNDNGAETTHTTSQ